MTLTVQIRDEELRDALRGEVSSFQRRAVLEMVLELYGRGILPAGKAMEIVGLTRRELLEAMKSRDKQLPFDADEIQRELEWSAQDRRSG